MADRSSAALFAEFFVMLARDPSDDHKAMAKELFEMTNQYDFSTDQMGADAALKKLGIEIDETFYED